MVAHAAVFDALLLEVLGDTDSSADASLSCDESFADLQADLDALDALIEQHASSPSPLLLPTPVDATAHSAAAPLAAAFVLQPACESASACAGEPLAARVDVTPSVPKPKSAPGGNNARKRQREELRSLRSSAAMLEEALRTLQRQTGASVASSASPPSALSAATSSSSETRPRSTLAPDQKVPRRGPQLMSKPCATLDEHARQITELENMHLSKLVKDHVRVAQSFDKTLRKHRPLSAAEILAEAPRALVLTAAPRLKETPLPSSTPTASDLDAFAALERNVDARYHDVERVFQAVGLSECRTNVREATLETQRAEGVLLSFKTSRLIPFSVQLINETAIRISKANHMDGPGQMLRRMGSTVSFKKQFQVGDITINARGVSKRYVEANRIVLIWDGVSEWQSDGDSDVITIEEKGWGIIQPFPQASSSSSSNSAASKSPNKNQKTPAKKHSSSSPSSSLSMLQSYISMTPGVGDGGAQRRQPQPKHIAVLSDVVLPSYQEIFEARYQHLENALLEDLLQRRLVA